MKDLPSPDRRPVTVPMLQTMREAGEKITLLTCYDASFATLLDNAHVDALLVGDSLGNVLQGHSTTLPVTVADLVYHTECVARGNQTALVIADLPFGSYVTAEQAFTNAASLMRAGAHMVKLEGGAWLSQTVQFLVERAIPVCVHLGLTPQSVHTFGGFKVQGKTEAAASQLLNDALALQQAGAQLVVLEAIPATVAAKITHSLTIPTIGIGAGPDCSGQVLVLYDMLGIFPGKRPRFAKNFLVGQPDLEQAIRAYVREVKEVKFPTAEHTF